MLYLIVALLFKKGGTGRDYLVWQIIPRTINIVFHRVRKEGRRVRGGSLFVI